MSEENSNFHQLLKLRAQENPEIIEWFRKRDNKYTSPAIQNEMLEAMALGMMRQISNIQHAQFFTFSMRSFSRSWLTTFSSPEAALLLVSTKNRDLWPGPTPEVRDSRTSRHSAHAQSQA